MAIPSEPGSHSAALLRAFQIESEDLEANRTGRLGPAQGRRLLRSGTANLAGAFLIGILLAAILYGVAAKPLAPIQWILCIILFVIVLIVGIRYFSQTRAAVAEGRVESLVGQVHVHSRGRAGWYLTVADPPVAHSTQVSATHPAGYVKIPGSASVLYLNQVDVCQHEGMI